MQNPLTGTRSGILSVAATSGASVYQAGNSRVLTDSLASEGNSGKSDSGPSGGVIDSPRVISASLVQHTPPSSSDSIGNDSGSTGNGDINQGSGSINVWPPVGTSGTTSDVLEPNPWQPDPDPVYVFPVVSDDPVPGIDPPAPGIDPLTPVPEPSQIALMLTVIALVGLLAKRPAGKHGIAVR
jgi:hypothetical protein